MGLRVESQCEDRVFMAEGGRSLPESQRASETGEEKEAAASHEEAMEWVLACLVEIHDKTLVGEWWQVADRSGVRALGRGHVERGRRRLGGGAWATIASAHGDGGLG